MSLIPREKIDEVRERTNLVEVVKRHVELRRAGTGSWKGLCPFHSEKTPSFHVHEQRQFFHCFGCGEKGDVFEFLTRIDKRSFMEVLRDLAQQAAVELPEKPQSPAERKAAAEQQSEKERMCAAMEIATAFFEGQLQASAGTAARAYVEGRGILPATLQRFRVGYAPASWNALQSHLADKNVPPHLALQLGLTGENERGQFDFFRDRVMLPVLDRQKRPVGYSSRLLDPEAKDRKYVNSPDSPLFHKKEQLYGLPLALDAIRKSGTAVVVEGNFDVLTLHGAGVEETVAPMGTALTAEQVAKLSTLASRVVVVFDGDEAGQRAARKVLPMFVEAGVDGYLARMPTGMDPDDFVRREGVEAFRELLAGARPMVEQFIDDVSREAEATIPGRVQALELAAPVIARVRNATERELYVGRLAGALGLSLQQVLRSVRGARVDRRPQSERTAGGGPAGLLSSAPGHELAAEGARIPPRDELEVVVLLAARPDLARMPEARRALDLLLDAGVRQIYRCALDALEQGAAADVPAWLDAGPPDIRRAVGAAIMDGRYDGVEAVDRALRALVTRLERSRVDAEITLLGRQQREALSRGDEDTARAISVREMELIRIKQGLAKPN